MYCRRTKASMRNSPKHMSREPVHSWHRANSALDDLVTSTSVSLSSSFAVMAAVSYWLILKIDAELMNSSESVLLLWDLKLLII